MFKFYGNGISNEYADRMAATGKRANLKPKETAQWIMANEYTKGALKSELITPIGMKAISEGLRRIVVEDKVLKSSGMMDEDTQREANYTEHAFYQFETNLKMNVYKEAPSKQNPDNYEPIRTGGA